VKTKYLTLADFGAVLKKNWLPILLALLLLFGAGAGIRLAIPATYSTDATYYVRNMQGEEFIKKNGLTTSQLASVQTLCKEYATLIETCDGLYDRTLEKLSSFYPQMTREELRGMVSATSDNTLIRVTVTHTDPAVADTVAAALQGEVAGYINETAWPHLSAEMQCVTLAGAALPAAQSSAHPLVIGALTGVLGAFLAYLFFLLRFLFGNTLRDADEITRALPELPLLGEVRPDRLFALRTNLTVRLKSSRCPLVGVLDVDGAPGLLAGALAGSLSATEKKVLILDLKLQTAEDAPGLYAHLAGEAPSLDALLRHTEDGDVMYLAGGTGKAPMDLLATDRFGALLQQLSEVLDYIVVDFDDPDVAALLSAHISGYVLVAATKKTGARELRRAHDVLQSADARLLGLAIEGTDRRRDA